MNLNELLASAVEEESAISVDVGDEWLQGRTLYGGLQGALAVLAMRRVVDEALPLRTLQITFIGPVPAGTVRSQAQLLRRGRSAQHAHAEIRVDGVLCLTAVGIFGAARDSRVHSAAKAPPCRVSVDDAFPFPYQEGKMPAFLQHFESRGAEGQPLFSGMKQDSCKLYSRLRDLAIVSDAHLLTFVDITPPVVSSQFTEPTPASSMNWQLEVLRSPAELSDVEWFRVDAEVDACHNGYCWQTTRFWTDRGDLIAISRQCLAVFG